MCKLAVHVCKITVRVCTLTTVNVCKLTVDMCKLVTVYMCNLIVLMCELIVNMYIYSGRDLFCTRHIHSRLNNYTFIFRVTSLECIFIVRCKHTVHIRVDLL
jgi:hypothetical protein